MSWKDIVKDTETDPHPEDDEPMRRRRRRRPDDVKPPKPPWQLEKWGGNIDTREEALEAIEKFQRKYRSYLHGNVRQLGMGPTNFKMDARRLLKQLHGFLKYNR